MEIDQKKHDEFVALLVGAQRSIYAYLYMLVHHHADAEDLLQQVSIILWHKFDTYESGSDFRAWACRVAHFEALNFLRSRRSDGVELSDALLARLAETKMARADSHDIYRDALEMCLEKLPDASRRLVECCYGESQTLKDLAEELDRPAGSLYVSLSRIRQSLLKCVQTAVNKEGD